jgi:chemotaxis protein CheX
VTSTSDAAVLAVDDVAGIAEAVWASFLGDIEVGILDSEPPRITGEDIISAYVLVGGAWQGGVVLACGQHTAQRLASVMFAIPGPVGEEDMGDAVGELANVLGGNVKSLLPQPSAISLPVVTSGADYAHEPPEAREVCHLDLNWSGDVLSLRVWTRDEQ